MLTTIISRFGGIRKVKDFDLSDFICIIGLFVVSIGMAAIYVFILHPEDNPTLTSYPLIRKVEAVEVREVEDVPEAPVLTDEEILAAVVMAEAGNQDMLGKVAVASVVLNRCDYFGLTVESVVKAKGQFSFPYYGTVSEDCYRAVEIAEQSRDLFPNTMLYFRNTRFHNFGIPYQKLGDHYFSLIESED